ncbi:MAG: hypothetical protein ACXAEN_14300 [Candidatus Thorarchaeota archaeon]|jgi:hypothetical protein
MAAILEITDGTVTIDFLNGATETGLHLESWRPNVPAFKGGGVFQESALSFGRQLVDRQFNNHVETFNLKASAANQDNVIRTMQEIRRLLEKAAMYWVADWQDEPVWIKAKASNETNARYAIIVAGSIVEDENPYSQPFLQPTCAAVMNALTLVLEHMFWSSEIPGTGTATALSTVVTFDGRNLGNVDASGVRETQTDIDSVFIVNKHNIANLSDVYIDDGGAFSANLLDAALPYALFPAVPVVGDALYLGCDTTLTNSGPFNNLVFDISVVESGNWDIAWQYWDGGAWASLINTWGQDNTANDGIIDVDPFTTLGVRSVSWLPPTDWATTTVNGVTGYWVRCYVYNAGAGPHTIPTQQNRNPYSVTWPYVEIQSTGVLGDIQALAHLLMRNQSDPGGASSPPASWSNNVTAGLRSVSRGENFSAFINLSDEQNAAGITVAATGFGSAFATDVQAASGRLIDAPNAAAAEVFATVVIASPLYEEYVGDYQLYVRARQVTGSVGDVTMSVAASIGGGVAPREVPFTSVSATEWEILSFGKVRLPDDVLEYISVTFSITLTGDGAADCDLGDLILIPVDEMAFLAEDPFTNSTRAIGWRGSPETQYLTVDSVSRLKRTRAAVARYATDLIVDSYVLRIAGQLRLQSNSRQRLWILNSQFDDQAATLEKFCPVQTLNTVKIEKYDRYLSMRGGR